MSLCKCGQISTTIITYKDQTVEPVCDDCYEIKMNYIPVYDTDGNEIVAGDTVKTTWGNELKVIMKDNRLTCIGREDEDLEEIINDYIGVWVVKREGGG